MRPFRGGPSDVRPTELLVRSVVADAGGHLRSVLTRRPWDPARAAVVICDMWDAHHCVSAARRVAEMAPRMNDVISRLRRQGALIIHGPQGCMDFYEGSPARERARRAPLIEPPCPIDWNGWERDPDSGLPPTLTDPGPCSCASREPCGNGEPPYPWTRQIEALEVLDDEDAVTDDGAEVFRLLEERGIEDVAVMGVHTNICVLGRPYGIRQLVFLGKRPLLCRDLTDSFHKDPRGHAWGTDRIVGHIEKRWCPTLTSDQLVGGRPFRFSDDE